MDNLYYIGTTPHIAWYRCATTHGHYVIGHPHNSDPAYRGPMLVTEPLRPIITDGDRAEARALGVRFAQDVEVGRRREWRQLGLW